MLFQKVVSNLPFSPALVSQLGFYAKRLQKEQMTRRIGLLFTALALIVQSFALLSPPEPALAANPNNIIFNGINSKDDLLNAWDKNSDGHGHKDIQQIFKYFLGQDFSRKDIEATKKGKFGSRDKVNGGNILSLGRTQQTSDPAQKAHSIRDANGNKSTIWSRHLAAFDTGANKSGRGSMYEAYIGSHKGKWFAVMFDCGNIAFSDTNKVPTVTPQLTVKATCREVTGYAYDQSNLKAGLKVYLYLDGGPGKGEKLSTTANLTAPDDGVEGNHGFKFTVPSKYHTGKKYDYTVVVSPAYSENHSVQRSGSIDTATCKPAQPVARCEALQFTKVQGKRDSFTLKTSAYAADGAKITGYRYDVTDKNGAMKYSKNYNSTATTHSSEVITLPDAGDYTAKATVLTSIGEQTSPDCAKVLTVTPPEKCTLNPELNANDKDCKPCPGDSSIWIKDAECNPEIIQAKRVTNITQNIPNANGTTAKAGDRLQYELYVENTGKVATTIDLDEDMSDVLEYATLTDFGGQNSAYNADSKTLTWKNVKLAPGEKFSKTLIVEVKDQIPATPKSAGNPESYDCRMGNVFGGASVVVKVQCPEEKIVESTVESLPETGTGANILFSTALLLVVTYFYMRSRQMNKEVRLIKKEFNSGTV